MSDTDQDRNENFRTPSDPGATSDVPLLDAADHIQSISMVKSGSDSSPCAGYTWNRRRRSRNETNGCSVGEALSKNSHEAELVDDLSISEDSLSDDNFEVICSSSVPSVDSRSLINSPPVSRDSTSHDGYMTDAIVDQVSDKQIVLAPPQWNPYDVNPELLLNDSFQFQAYYPPWVYPCQPFFDDNIPQFVNLNEINNIQHIITPEPFIHENTAEVIPTLETAMHMPGRVDPTTNMYLGERADPIPNNYLGSEPNYYDTQSFHEPRLDSGFDMFNSQYLPTNTSMNEELDSQNPTFHYPSIYVSQSGLITVLLKNDISVEMTADRTIRVVSHQRKMAAATSSRGNASCIYHPTAKIKQESTCVDADLFLGRRIRMTTENIIFTNMFQSFNFDYKRICSLEKEDVVFPDISHDYSVNMLFSSTGYGEEVVAQCMHLARNAVYENLPNGAFVVKINGVKIMQYPRGDVSVLSGPKFIKVSPNTGFMYLQTHFVEMSVEVNWCVKIRRGSHTLNASSLGFVVANGKIEAGFNEDNKMRAYKLPERKQLFVGVQNRRPRQGQNSDHWTGSMQNESNSNKAEQQTLT